MSKGQVGREAIFLSSISTSLEVCKLCQFGVNIVHGRALFGWGRVLVEARIASD